MHRSMTSSHMVDVLQHSLDIGEISTMTLTHTLESNISLIHYDRYVGYYPKRKQIPIY